MRRMCGPSTPAAWQNNQQSRYCKYMGATAKPPANRELILGWTVVTGSRVWLCWCQVDFDHCHCHPNLVDMSPQRNEKSRLQWLFRSTLATLCDALWWVTQWCGSWIHTSRTSPYVGARSMFCRYCCPHARYYTTLQDVGWIRFYEKPSSVGDLSVWTSFCCFVWR